MLYIICIYNYMISLLILNYYYIVIYLHILFCNYTIYMLVNLTITIYIRYIIDDSST